jgi:hypothetical protein
MQSRIALHEVGRSLAVRGYEEAPYMGNRTRERAPTMPQGGGEDTEGQGK